MRKRSSKCFYPYVPKASGESTAGIAAGPVSVCGTCLCPWPGRIKGARQACWKALCAIAGSIVNAPLGNRYLLTADHCLRGRSPSLSSPCLSLKSLMCSVCRAAWPESLATMLSATVMVQMSCSAVSTFRALSCSSPDCQVCTCRQGPPSQLRVLVRPHGPALSRNIELCLLS